VNVLVEAFRADAPEHGRIKPWLDAQIAGAAPFGLADIVLSGFLRVTTHPRVFKTPTPIADALAFLDVLRAQPNAVVIAPGPRHWPIFTQLCTDANAKGNLVPDAYLAALAIESGSEWISSDRDFARFPGLKWRHPLA
jgi:toxin-antitoxin system PIN domain toxin